MNISFIIEQSFEIFLAHHHRADEPIYSSFKKKGWDEITCSKVLVFVPLAFCRLLLYSSGVSFSEYYINMQSDTKEKIKLSSEPFFDTAFNIAISKSKIFNKDYFMAIAKRSSEFNVINRSLNQGSNLEDLILTPPVVFF